MQDGALTCTILHSDTTLLQPNRTNTPVHTETEQYTYIQSPAPEDECNNIRNMMSNKKLSKSDIKLVPFIQLVHYSIHKSPLHTLNLFLYDQFLTSEPDVHTFCTKAVTPYVEDKCQRLL